MEERVETPKQLAERVGLTKRQINKLIGDGKLEHVCIGERKHIPVGAWGRFVQANTRGGHSWQDETRALNSNILKTEKPTTSPGQTGVAAASARLAQQAANTLRSSSQIGCRREGTVTAQVIPLKS
jgi:hypothetical protein